jgi:hypothetical protein
MIRPQKMLLRAIANLGRNFEGLPVVLRALHQILNFLTFYHTII